MESIRHMLRRLGFKSKRLTFLSQIFLFKYFWCLEHLFEILPVPHTNTYKPQDLGHWKNILEKLAGDAEKQGLLDQQGKAPTCAALRPKPCPQRTHLQKLSCPQEPCQGWRKRRGSPASDCPREAVPGMGQRRVLSLLPCLVHCQH